MAAAVAVEPEAPAVAAAGQTVMVTAAAMAALGAAESLGGAGVEEVAKVVGRAAEGGGQETVEQQVGMLEAGLKEMVGYWVEVTVQAAPVGAVETAAAVPAAG